MKILAETHCHTLVSVHAYCTVSELIEETKKKNMELISITDHTPALGDGPMEWHFSCLKFIPREYEGVKILRGAEVNILNEGGEVDLSNEVLKKLDLVIASFHSPCIKNLGTEGNTNAMINAIKNPYIDVVGHCGNSAYPLNYEKLVSAVKSEGKIIEINNNSFNCRAGSHENCRKVALLCKKMQVPVVVSSDAHFKSQIGDYENSLVALEDVNFPEELVLNTSAKKLIDYLREKRGKNL